MCTPPHERYHGWKGARPSCKRSANEQCRLQFQYWKILEEPIMQGVWLSNTRETEELAPSAQPDHRCSSAMGVEDQMLLKSMNPHKVFKSGKKQMGHFFKVYFFQQLSKAQVTETHQLCVTMQGSSLQEFPTTCVGVCQLPEFPCSGAQCSSKQWWNEQKHVNPIWMEAQLQQLPDRGKLDTCHSGFC